MMHITRSLVICLLLFCMTACDSPNESVTEHNAIKDKIYSEQFDALEKSKQVEGMLLDAAQAQREAIDKQSGQ